MEQSRSLNIELEELFDNRFAKSRDDKTLNHLALEAASRQTVVRIRPFLSSLGKQMTEFYRN